MQRAIIFCVWAVIFLATAASTDAALIVTVPSATFNTTDGTDTLDVTITGDGATSFGAFTLTFDITPENSTEPLQFDSSNPAYGPTLPQSDGYVFYGNSADVGPPASPFVSSLSSDKTMLTVDDATADSSDVTLANGTSALLAQLVFTVPTTITNAGGDKFDLTLVNPNGSPTTDFQSNNTGNVDVDGAGGTFTGVITVQSPQAAAVPEPGTFGMLLVGMSGLALAKRRRSRAGEPVA